jgi:DNA primase
MVSPEKQIWHDFSSGKGGNMFSFVMEMEGLDFKGALELLARKAGVDLEQYRTKGGRRSNTKEKERLHDALELAAKFYLAQFAQNKTAIEYVVQKRKFTRDTVREWQLGYSPNTGDALAKFLLGRKFSALELKGAGLSAQRYRGTGDMFRGRLMVPLHDAQGRVIGFTARILEDDPNAPKYINTPQTLLYDKSRHVYGLHLAKEAIRKCKYVVIAEGNLDVISSHQAGVRQVVATAGTALTEQHLKALSRFTGDIRLCFDADKAGLNATERAIPIASKVGVSLSIITIPSGKDPDELIKQDPNIWKEIIEKPQYAVDWLIDRYSTLLDITSAQGKREFSDVVLKVVRGLQDQVEQEHYIGRVAELIGVSRDALLSKLNQKEEAPRLKKTRRRDAPAIDKAVQDMIRTENNLLALALLQPKTRFLLKHIKPQMLVEEQARELLAFLEAHPDFAGAGSGAAKPAELPEAWRPLSDYGKMLSLVFEQYYQELEISELLPEAARQQFTLIERYVKMQKQRIMREMESADEARGVQLLEAANKLDNLLRTHKGA